MISVLRQVASVRVPDTTYFMVSLKNGAPGSSSTVRVDHAGSNIWYVVRPSRMPWQLPVTLARVSPILGSKPKSKVHSGASITPSRLMNSCTRILPMSASRSVSGHSNPTEGGSALYRQPWRDDEEELDGTEEADRRSAARFYGRAPAW